MCEAVIIIAASLVGGIIGTGLGLLILRYTIYK